MVHRIDRVVPDLDDRLIPPNAARNSLNMRFAASIGDTNLSMSLVNGMSELEYPEENPLPAGDNQVIGVKEDFETQSVFFMLWNSNGDGGLYRIQGNAIALVLKVPGLVEDSDVSIAVIDNKAYWTDNISQPRMCNIKKGIDNLYPSPLEEWMITQIKRPPGLPLKVEQLNSSNVYASVDQWNVRSASNDYSLTGVGIFNNDVPFQFSYYYIYDNEEESVLSPYSVECYFTESIKLTVPVAESAAYLNGINMVKNIVYLYRQGVDGIWYVAKNTTNNGTYVLNIPNLLRMPKITVSSDITNRQFDAMPLLSISNETAQNRLNHANYLTDYDTVSTLTLTAAAVQAPFINVATVLNNKVHKPGAIYNVGVELLDEWGRRIGVVNQTPVKITNNQGFASDVNWDNPYIPFNVAKDVTDNNYWIEYTVSGTVPSWCKYYRVVESAAQTVVSFHRFTSSMLYWYEGEDGLSYLSRIYMGPIFRQDILEASFKDALDFYHKGYALYLPTGIPIQFSKGDETFVQIIGSFVPGNVPRFDFATYGGDEYKVVKQVDNVLYFRLQEDILDPAYLPQQGLADGLTNGPVYFFVDVTTKTKSASEIYYQNQAVFEVPSNGIINQTGTLKGDCYLTYYEKIYNPWFTSFIQYFLVSGSKSVIYTTDPDNSFPFRGGETNGIVIAMNPTDVYSQSWNPEQGQISIVNENQRQVRILQGIIFSDSLIQGTQINGLSKFNSVDNRQAPLENGPITALVRTSATQREPGVLLAIGENGVSSFYYDGIQLTNIDGTANVSTSDKYLASQRPLVGNYGAKKLRNICATPLGTVYYWSEGITDWIRYTNAGLEQLGETYQFMNYLRNQLNSSTSVMMTYDQVTDEAIIVGDDSNAYIFSERFKTFQGARQYYDANNIRPERGATLSTRTFFFLEGHIWQMGPSVAATTENSFFGTLRDPSLTLVTNEMPTVAKQWNSIKVLGNRPLTCQMNSGNSELPSVESYIDQDWWINRKGDWDAAVRRDQNSVGGVMNGKIMESRILISTFAWDATDFDKLNYIEVKSNKSIVQ
jgi:hypothetical protein